MTRAQVVAIVCGLGAAVAGAFAVVQSYPQTALQALGWWTCVCFAVAAFLALVVVVADDGGKGRR